jgi:hypothetical protein
MGKLTNFLRKPISTSRAFGLYEFIDGEEIEAMEFHF